MRDDYDRDGWAGWAPIPTAPPVYVCPACGEAVRSANDPAHDFNRH